MIVVETLKSVLPVVLTILIGYACKRQHLFDETGLETLKAVIGNVCLPVVLFEAFYTANYSIAVIPVFFSVYAGFVLAMLAGFALKRFFKPHDRFLPFLITNAEGGMLGYALYTMVCGADKVSNFAVLDLGQTVCAFTAFLTALKLSGGQKMTAKEIVLNMTGNRACQGIFLGILLGVTGVRGLVDLTPAAPVLSSIFSFLKAPTGCIILIVVGYQLSLKAELLGCVMKTVLTRLVCMVALFIAVSAVVFAVMPFDRDLQLAMMILYALPAPFIIPIYADMGKDGEYVSTALSLQTIVTVILFAGIVVYSIV